MRRLFSWLFQRKDLGEMDAFPAALFACGANAVGVRGWRPGFYFRHCFRTAFFGWEVIYAHYRPPRGADISGWLLSILGAEAQLYPGRYYNRTLWSLDQITPAINGTP